MPGSVWDKAIALATDQYGFITHEDLRGLGEDPVRLRQWAQRGGVERVGHGIYRFKQIPATSLDPYMLATLWPAGRGVLSHDTALELFELCDINPDKIHITLPASRSYRPRRQGGEQYVVHHEDLDQADVTWHEEIRIVSPAVAIRQALDSSVPTHLVRQAIETAQRLGRVPLPKLAELSKRLEDRR
jgi:predicted transcriptional regulator of viral defense system